MCLSHSVTLVLCLLHMIIQSGMIMLHTLVVSQPWLVDADVWEG